MTKHGTIIAGATAVIVLAISGTAALAAPATSKAPLNVRSGPGTNYGVVDTLYKGERVEVSECVSNGWCYIKHPGPDGWVSAKYLIAGTAPRPPVYNPPIQPRRNPPVSFGFSINSGGNFSFGFGIGGVQTNPHQPPFISASPTVCFYKGVNFSGSKRCVTPGTYVSRLPVGWNNRISSIKLTNGAAVKICRNQNYQGGCAIVRSNKRSLGPNYNNTITSFQAF